MSSIKPHRSDAVSSQPTNVSLPAKKSLKAVDVARQTPSTAIGPQKRLNPIPLPAPAKGLVRHAKPQGARTPSPTQISSHTPKAYHVERRPGMPQGLVKSTAAAMTQFPSHQQTDKTAALPPTDNPAAESTAEDISAPTLQRTPVWLLRKDLPSTTAIELPILFEGNLKDVHVDVVKVKLQYRIPGGPGSQFPPPKRRFPESTLPKPRKNRPNGFSTSPGITKNSDDLEFPTPPTPHAHTQTSADDRRTVPTPAPTPQVDPRLPPGTPPLPAPPQSDPYTETPIDLDKYGEAILRDGKWYYETHLLNYEGDYVVTLALTDKSGHRSEQSFDLFVRTKNYPPRLGVPEDVVISKNSLQQRFFVSVGDDQDEYLTITSQGYFTAPGKQDKQEITLHKDASSMLVFEPQTAELGTYTIIVKATDPFGESVEKSFAIKVIDGLKGPTIHPRQASEIEVMAPRGSGPPDIHALEFDLEDPDTPVSELNINTWQEIEYDGPDGPNMQSYPPRVQTLANGQIRIEARVPKGVNSKSTVKVQVIDQSGLHQVSTTTIDAVLPAVPPVVSLPKNVRLPTSETPVQIVLGIHDPNQDSIAITSFGEFQKLGSVGFVELNRDNYRVINIGRQKHLEFIPSQPGLYRFRFGAFETNTAAKTSTHDDMVIEVKPAQELSVQSQVWTAENGIVSHNQTKSATLKGIPETTQPFGLPQGLLGDRFIVRGSAPFEAGHGPDDPHNTFTATHDSFAISVAFELQQRIKGDYEAAHVGMTYAQMITALGPKPFFVTNVNAMRVANAVYDFRQDETAFGVATNDQGIPVLDLGTAQGVGAHETHHMIFQKLMPYAIHGEGSNLHEAYGDMGDAVMHRNPKVAEVFSLIDAKMKFLRNSHNHHKLSEMPDKPHQKGMVYAGLFWDVLEYLHEQVTGTKRSDDELIDENAATIGKDILWNFPIYLGSVAPTGADFVRSLLRTIDSLEQGGMFPKSLSPQAINTLRTLIINDAVYREIIKSADDPRTEGSVAIATPGVTTELEALKATLQRLGLGGKIDTVKVHEVYGPLGEKFSRFTIATYAYVNGHPQPVRFEREMITVITMPDGTFQTQTGSLPKHLKLYLGKATQPQSPDSSTAVSSTDLRPGGVRLSQTSFNNAVNRMVTQASKELLLTDGRDHRGIYPPGVFGLVAPQAARQLREGHSQSSLVWREGQMMAKLDLGKFVYYAPLSHRGRIGTIEREGQFIVDHFDPRDFQ